MREIEHIFNLRLSWSLFYGFGTSLRNVNKVNIKIIERLNLSCYQELIILSRTFSTHQILQTLRSKSPCMPERYRREGDQVVS